MDQITNQYCAADCWVQYFKDQAAKTRAAHRTELESIRGRVRQFMDDQKVTVFAVEVSAEETVYVRLTTTTPTGPITPAGIRDAVNRLTEADILATQAALAKKAKGSVPRVSETVSKVVTEKLRETHRKAPVVSLKLDKTPGRGAAVKRAAHAVAVPDNIAQDVQTWKARLQEARNMEQKTVKSQAPYLQAEKKMAEPLRQYLVTRDGGANPVSEIKMTRADSKGQMQTTVFRVAPTPEVRKPKPVGIMLIKRALPAQLEEVLERQPCRVEQVCEPEFKRVLVQELTRLLVHLQRTNFKVEPAGLSVKMVKARRGGQA